MHLFHHEFHHPLTYAVLIQVFSVQIVQRTKSIRGATALAVITENL